MKRSHVLLILLFTLSACLPPPATLVPAETLAAQTMQAMAKADTPTPTFTDIPTLTPTLEQGTPTPEINMAATGAYCLPLNTERHRGIVARVLDAETIEVSVGYETYRVRYIGLDAPGVIPTLEWQGPQAAAANERLVGGKYVTLVRDVSQSDPQGFFLRYVLVDDIFVNYDLIRQGYAKALSMPPDIACDNALMAAQVEAQTTVKGIWQASPVPTFTYTPIPSQTITPTITLTPTRTRRPPCTCRDGITCNLFSTQDEAQECYDYCLDIGWGEIMPDKNNNGLVCEGLP